MHKGWKGDVTLGEWAEALAGSSMGFVMVYLLGEAGHQADFFLQAFQLFLKSLSFYTPHNSGCLVLILRCVSSLLSMPPMGDVYSILSWPLSHTLVLEPSLVESI